MNTNLKNSWVKTLGIALLSMGGIHSSANAETYQAYCSRITNDVEKLAGIAHSVRFNICDSEGKECVLLIESAPITTPTDKKAFAIDNRFEFSDAQINEILKNKNWDLVTARFQSGFVTNGEFHGSGTSKLSQFLKDSKKYPFMQFSSYGMNTGVITTNRCSYTKITE